MRRVALVTTSYPSADGDASGHFVRSEARRLAAAGHDVVVIKPGASDLCDPGVRVIGIADQRAFGWPGVAARLRAAPWRAPGVVHFVLGARRALAREAPWSRVIAHFMIPSGFPIASGSDAPVEVVGHGSDVRLLLALPQALRRRAVTALLETTTTFRFVSDELAELFLSEAPPAAGRIRVEPCPLDVGEPVDRADARAKLGIAPGTRLAIVAGRALASKRMDVALSALGLLDGIERVVIGDGPALPLLKARFSGVRFTGHLERPDALAWIAAADVVVSASELEGAPTVVREARLLGVPVVAVAAGDLERAAQQDPELFVVGRTRRY
jgi:glycosyltransferase involved in cell wall biosynthesis